MAPKLIICVDGLGRDLISKEDTPFLWEFGKKHSLSELQTLFAFTGIEYCFFTGKTPEETNIWLEFSKEDNSIFNNLLLKTLGLGKLKTYIGALLQLANKRTWLSGLYHIPKEKLKYFDTSAKRGLWELEFFNKKSFSFYKWPFFATERNRKLIFKYENDEKRLERIFSERGKDIYCTQIMKIDQTLHKFGKGSEEAKKALKSTDLLVEKYVEKFLYDYPKGEVFLWGDHSLANIKNFINIEKLLPKSSKYLKFIEGTTACFWFKDEEIKNELLNSIKKEKRIKVLNQQDAKKYKIPFSKKYGEVVLYTEKGNYFFPNYYQKKEDEKFTAMHGYPDDKEMNGVVISNRKLPQALKMKDMIKYLI